MPAPKANKYWKQRKRHGRKPIYASDELLWQDCVKYFEWVTDNSLPKDTIYSYQGNVYHEPIHRPRPMTLSGLWSFLGINKQTWYDWRNHKDFSAIVTRVDNIIHTNKFEGAVSGIFNPNIIARELRLGTSDSRTEESPANKQTSDHNYERIRGRLKELDH